MQSFLPYPEFDHSAAVLDPLRLRNQPNEAMVMLRTLLGLYPGKSGWPNHPATKMWFVFEGALAFYGYIVCLEIERRGWRAPHKQEFKHWYDYLPKVYPPWLGNESLHTSHRQALLAKDFKWYSQFGWPEKPAIFNSKGSLPYYWPPESYRRI